MRPARRTEGIIPAALQTSLLWLSLSAICAVLPYISEAEAEAQGWKKWLGNLAEVLPGRMIGGKIYRNRDHRLPESDGRIWHEADFDYVNGYRNTCRLLYSNDGLLFVTYDHYLTFFEIELEGIK